MKTRDIIVLAFLLFGAALTGQASVPTAVMSPSSSPFETGSSGSEGTSLGAPDTGGDVEQAGVVGEATVSGASSTTGPVPAQDLAPAQSFNIETASSPGLGGDAGGFGLTLDPNALISGLAGDPMAIAPIAIGALGSALLINAGIRFIGTGLIAPLYHRIRKDGILDCEGRQRVYDAVAADPGIALRDLIGSTGYSGGTVVYHIRRLEKARLVTSQRAGRNRRLYVTGASMESRAAIPILRNATARRIAAYLLKHPGAVQRDVCEGVGISPPVAHKYLARLLDAGLVTATRDWKFVHYRPEERLHSLVATVGYDGLEQRAAPMAPIPAISQRAQPVSA